MKARTLALLVLVVAMASALVYQRVDRPAAVAGLASASLGRLMPAPAPAPAVTVTRLAAEVDVVPAVDLPERTAPPARGAATPEALQLQVAGAVDRPHYPGQARQLTQDGCCAGSWWSDDSSALYMVDRPAAAAQAALYRLPLWPPGAEVEPADVQLLLDAQASRYVVRPAGDHSMVEDVVTGDSWPLPTGGNPARLSPDGSRVVWWAARDGSDRFSREVRVFGSRVDGSDVRDLGALWGTEVVSFLPDNRRVLVTGRPATDRAVAVLATLDVESGQLTGIARGLWLGHARSSPDGQWVAYTVSLDREDPAANGVWLAAVDGGPPRKMPFEGAYRWRDGNRLVFVPLQPGATSHEVWQYDVAADAMTRLLDPTETPLRIANNDWSIAPDGSSLAWLEEMDRNLWVVDLP